MASALIASAELALVIGVGAAVGAVSLMVAAAISKSISLTGMLGKLVSVMLPPMLVAVGGPYIMDAIPGTDAGTSFGLIFALITAAGPLTTYAKAKVHKYATGWTGDSDDSDSQ